MKRSAGMALLASMAALLPACGGGGGASGPTAVPTPTSCTQTVLFQGNADLDAGFAAGQEFTVTAATRLDVIVDWTFSQSPMGIYVFQGTCNLDQFTARTCNFVVASEPSLSKPRRASAPNVAPGSYTLLIANFGQLNESLAAQVIASSATCPALGRSGTAAGQ
jgi:hypothetical protein